MKLEGMYRTETRGYKYGIGVMNITANQGHTNRSVEV